MKTGYCHIYNHKMPLDSITDRLHIGNRWLGLSGLAMYDNTARVHDPVMPHMLTCDSRAVDYPGHSPFSHCAGNPGNISDKDGNKIKLNGNANDIKQALSLLQNSIGNYYNLSCGSDGIVTGGNLPLRSYDNLNRIQQKLVDRINPMLNDPLISESEIVNESTEVLFGSVEQRKIDMGDIMHMKPDDICNPTSILWHELFEQWLVANKLTEEKAATDKDNIYKLAHKKATELETLLKEGKIVFDPWDRCTDEAETNLRVGYYYPGQPTIQYKILYIMDNNIDTNRP